MRKVFLVAFFHPFTAVRGGSFRVLPLVKYLHEFDWQPVVLTAPLRERPSVTGEVVETGYRETLGLWKRLFRIRTTDDVKTQIKQRFGVTAGRSTLDYLLSFAGELFYYPDSYKGWRDFAVARGSELLKEQKFDAILSCHPATSHVIASELKSRSGLPWLADLPDLWSQNHNYSYSRWRRKRDARLELATLSRADAMVTVSEPWAEKLRTLHKGKTVYSVTHGFDLGQVNDPPAPLTEKFTITYTGTIYPEGEDPAKLLMALSRLITDGVLDVNKVEVRFYGIKRDWLDEEIKKWRLEGIVKQYGMLTPNEARMKQRESQLLLLLKWEDPAERGWHSGKIYEYMAARRPVLATGGHHDVITDLLFETGAGVDAPSVADIEDVLREAYQQFLAGRVVYKGNPLAINRYSHREMARKFAAILEGLL